MAQFKDRLADYVTVDQRIIAFYLKYPDGSIQSDMITLTTDLVVFRASAFRSPTDLKPGIGHSSLAIPGVTPYTRGSEIENAETSAWGRALAALGFEVKRGIASQNEIDNKRVDEPNPALEPSADYQHNEFVSDGRPTFASMTQRAALTRLAKKVDGGMDFLKRRMGDLQVTKDTITPQHCATITAELVELDAALRKAGEHVEMVEDDPIGF